MRKSNLEETPAETANISKARDMWGTALLQMFYADPGIWSTLVQVYVRHWDRNYEGGDKSKDWWAAGFGRARSASGRLLLSLNSA
jgi:hypothetical protein